MPIDRDLRVEPPRVYVPPTVTPPKDAPLPFCYETQSTYMEKVEAPPPKEQSEKHSFKDRAVEWFLWTKSWFSAKAKTERRPRQASLKICLKA